jgi:glutamate racemase
MKIGIFDSGLGGLFVARALVKNLPQYDYVYLGDTQRVPYGNRSHETVYQFLREAVDYLFAHDCELIIVACNTASAKALRRIQQEYLPKHYPQRRVLGIIIPTAEAALKNDTTRRIGLLATQGTVDSNAYVKELKKIRPNPEIEKRLGEHKRREFLVTDLIDATRALSKKWFGQDIKFRTIQLK